MKELDRTTEAIVPMNERWRKLNANITQYVPFRASMGQHCSLTAVQRKTACVEQSWWPEFDMFTQTPPKAGAKELLYRLQSKFDRWVYILVFAEGWLLQGKLSPCLCGHQCFSVVAHQDSPKASPRAIFKWKNLIEPLKLLSQWMKGGESWMPT